MFFFSLASVAAEKPDALYESYIGKIADGDKTALAELYGHTKSAVYGFALSMVQNKQDAEDILQDTFVSIYTSAHSYKKMGKPMAWILTIAKNLSLMKIRNRKKTADISEENRSLFKANEKTVPIEERLVLTAALKELTPEESRIVILHAVTGLKHREIAQLFELPLSTVLSKYNRAIRKLKSVLKEDDFREE